MEKAKIRKWLQKQETYTLHQQVRRRFRRQQVIVPYMDYQWDADTASMTTYTKDNDGYGFFVLVIDIFSWFLWTVPLRTTKGSEMSNALKSELREEKIIRGRKRKGLHSQGPPGKQLKTLRRENGYRY